MKIFVKVWGGQKNEHFFQGPRWAKKWKLFFKVRCGQKNEHFFRERPHRTLKKIFLPALLKNVHFFAHPGP